MSSNANHSWVLTLTLVLGICGLGAVALEYVSGQLLERDSLQARQKTLAAMLDGQQRLPAHINSVQGSKLSPHPYLLYANTPSYMRTTAQGSERQHNALGYRSDEFAVAKPSGVFRVLTLGGSTTYGVGVQRYQDAWPHQLQKLLEEHLPDGYSTVEVANAGLSGATSAELLSSWFFRHQYLEPDLVVLHLGGNDIGPLLYPDYDPEYTHYRARGVAYSLPQSIARLTASSNTARLLALSLVPDDPLQPVYIGYPYPLDEMDVGTTAERVRATAPRGFERNLRTLMQSIQSSGAGVALISFVMATEASVAETDAYLGPYIGIYAEALNKNRQAMQSISTELNVPYLQLEQAAIDDELFIDWCHLKPSGHELKAQLFSEFLVQNKLVKSGASLLRSPAQPVAHVQDQSWPQSPSHSQPQLRSQSQSP